MESGLGSGEDSGVRKMKLSAEWGFDSGVWRVKSKVWRPECRKGTGTERGAWREEHGESGEWEVEVGSPKDWRQETGDRRQWSVESATKADRLHHVFGVSCRLRRAQSTRSTYPTSALGACGLQSR